MTRALLIRPLCEGDDPEFAEPLGIERLAGYLLAHGVEVALLDRRLYAAEQRAGLSAIDATHFWADVREFCDAGSAPQIVGLSLMTAGDVPDARRIMSRLRAWLPEATFVAGGVFVTTEPAEAARLLPRSCVLLAGEGEQALLSLARGESANADYLAPCEWPEPYRPHLERYARLGCAVNMQTSRGCPGSCAFCATPQLPAALRRWQGRDVSLVACEMEHVAVRLEAAGLPPIFNLVDDDAGTLARLESLAAELRARELSVAWACEMRLAALIGQGGLAERIRALHEAGLTRLFVGVESLNPSTLRRWRKTYDVERLPEVLDAVRSAGVALQTGYILWHGHQTIEGAYEEARRLRELGIYTHQAAVSRLIVFAGSELGRALGRPTAFEPMAQREERFLHEFTAQTRDLRDRWVTAAIREPFAAARAHLSGDTTDLAALRQELAQINDQSYRWFSDSVHKRF